MIVVPRTSGQCEFSVILPVSLLQHSLVHYKLCGYKKWAQKFSVEGFFPPAGKHQQSPSFSTKNSAQIKINLNFDTKKVQGNRLAGSFLSSWQGITINSLLPLLPRKFAFLITGKRLVGEVGAIRTFCGAAALQSLRNPCTEVSTTRTQLYCLIIPLKLRMELFQKK